MINHKNSNLKFEWQHYVIQQNEDEDEPMGDKFFDNSESLTGVSSLIREAVQNSLDAFRDSTEPVRMRFFVGKMSEQLSKTYLSSLMPHIDSALDIPLANLDIASQKYLVVEDFNTNGLRGSTISKRPLKDSQDPYKDSFWYFEWKTGESNKFTNSGGKWGVGKVVFSFVSQVKTYLVYSSREKNSAPEGNNEIMFGHSVLKTHNLENQSRCKSKHRLMETDTDNNYVPFSDSAVVRKFVTDWNLSRKDAELGTSVVIPYCFEEFDIKTLTQALVQDYFMAILDESLECEIADAFGSTTVVLNAKTLMSNIEELPTSLKTDASKSKEELLSLCKLFLSRHISETKRIKISTSNHKPNSWDDVEIPKEIKDILAFELTQFNPVIVELEVAIPSRNKPSTLETGTCFIYLQQMQGFRTRTTFCRQGILVPDVSDKLPVPTDFLSLVHIPKGILADFFGAAEDPSHKSWAAKQEKFREYYKPYNVSKDGISFVRYSTNRIIQFAQNPESNQDKTSLAKYFPMADSGVPTLPPTAPKLLLFVRLDKENVNSLAFSWTVSNFQPTSMTLIQNIPQSLEIDLSVLDRAFLMDMENPNLTHEFFLRAKDGHRMIESNRVVIRPKTPSKAKIQITQKEAGFCITNSLKNQLRIGDVIEVRVAYDQRDGSPLRAWGPEDFILGKMLNKRRTWGLDVKCVENVAAITIKDNEFNVEFSGFDNLRDLLINTKLVSQ